jgi:hypothetical protein
MDLTKLDPKAPISQYFTFKDALWLPSWKRIANPSDGVTLQTIDNLKAIFKIMDKVREFIGKPIRVHVAYRSPEYNTLVKGAKNSAHLALDKGIAAVDWSVPSIDCDTVKQLIIPKLAEWGVRLEDNGKGATWLHLDTRAPGPGGRYFKP